MTTYSAPEIIESLVRDYGYDDALAALVEEVETGPSEQLDAVSELLDALMDALLADDGRGLTWRQTETPDPQ